MLKYILICNILYDYDNTFKLITARDNKNEKIGYVGPLLVEASEYTLCVFLR